MRNIKKLAIFSTLLLGYFVTANADYNNTPNIPTNGSTTTAPVPDPNLVVAPASPNANTQNVPSNAISSSNAIQFAIEAGSIAGAVQACGQDSSIFVTRVNEALNKLATNPGDKLLAMSYFQKTLQQAQVSQTNNHPIACNQVVQDYNSLPILRPDYEQTVIAQLTPGMSQAPYPNPNPNAQPNPSAPMQAPSPLQTPPNPAAQIPQPTIGGAPSNTPQPTSGAVNSTTTQSHGAPPVMPQTNPAMPANVPTVQQPDMNMQPAPNPNAPVPSYQSATPNQQSQQNPINNAPTSTTTVPAPAFQSVAPANNPAPITNPGNY